MSKLMMIEEGLPKIAEQYEDYNIIYGTRSDKCMVHFKNGECLICVLDVYVYCDSTGKKESFHAGCAWLDEARKQCYELKDSVMWNYLNDEVIHEI